MIERFESTEQENANQDLYLHWLESWLSEDFSWDGLAHKRRWLRQEGDNQQAQLREWDGNLPDPNLVEKGILISVPGRGLYHAAFIPRKWAEAEIFPLTVDELLARKKAFWNRVIGHQLRDNYSGVIAGPQIPNEIGAQLCSGTRASFEWCSFDDPSLRLVSRGTRAFRSCYFRGSTAITGDYSLAESKPSLALAETIFDETLTLGGLKGVKSVEAEECNAKGLFITDCELGSISLDNCDFSKLIAWDVAVSGKAIVRDCSFKSGIEITSSRWSEDLEIVESDIGGSLDLLRCDFEQRVTFADVTWPNLSFLAGSLSGSRFRGLATFASKDPPPIQIFREANFENGLALGGYTTLQWRQQLAAELASWQEGSISEADRLLHCQNIEAAARNLRKESEAEGDSHGEHFWHRSELIARSARSDIGPLESVFSRAYGLLADYGLSISRPFVAIGVVTLICALMYWVASSDSLFIGVIDWNSGREALGYSLSRTFPIGAFGYDDNIWRKDLLGTGGSLISIFIRSIATFQTIVSAILIYLGVMAIRRKFKIS